MHTHICVYAHTLIKGGIHRYMEKYPDGGKMLRHAMLFINAELYYPHHFVGLCYMLALTVCGVARCYNS